MNLVKQLSKSVDHFFPEFNQWLAMVKDHRHPLLITYHPKTLIWTALLMYLTHRGSRRSITTELRDGSCYKSLKQLSAQKQLEQVPHGDTLEYYMHKADINDFEQLNKNMIQRLIRMRVLEGARLQGYYLIALDGVHITSFDYQHCPNCVKKKHKNGKIQWQHYKVQASLVTPNGLYLPMASVWIENEEFYDKQDCEQKAAKRLFQKLKILYPQLKMCILLDSLYANEPMFCSLEELNMQWIIVFKKGSMPEVYRWIHRMIKQRNEEHQLTVRQTINIQSRSRRDHNQRVRQRDCIHRSPSKKHRTNIHLGEEYRPLGQ